jgi:hypothetical protein
MASTGKMHARIRATAMRFRALWISLLRRIELELVMACLVEIELHHHGDNKNPRYCEETHTL